MADRERTLSHDGRDYKIADLFQEARNQLRSLQLAEAEIKRLKMKSAMVQTARNAYQKALISAVPQDAHKTRVWHQTLGLIASGGLTYLYHTTLDSRSDIGYWARSLVPSELTHYPVQFYLRNEMSGLYSSRFDG